jgi:hypothetical protein
MHIAFFISSFHKGLIKIIHLKIQNHHATPTHLTMSEKHANRALCPENTKNHHQLGTGNIAYPETPNKASFGSSHPWGDWPGFTGVNPMGVKSWPNKIYVFS